MRLFSSQREKELEEELVAANQEIKNLKKAERKEKREANAAAKNKIAELEKAAKKTAEAHEEEVHKLNKEWSKKLEVISETTDKKVKEVTDENKRLTTKVEVLEETVEADTDIHRRVLAVEKREKIVEAKEEASNTLAKQFKELKEETEDAKQAEYTKGYADGLSDGIRKGIDSSQEDRKHLAQVAMVAAASHTPQAAEIVAKEIKNALPATTSSKNK